MSIPLNSGLVSIIGAKGSGKSALADFLAYAGGAAVLDDKRSFLSRAKQFVKGTSVDLVWGDGATTRSTIPTTAPSREMVRYLSQSFVEQLCSEDYAGISLAEEIENVIFGHLDPTDTLNASSFSSLRDLRTREFTKERIEIGSRIKSMIGEDETLRENLRGIPSKKKRIEELAQEAESLQKQIPRAESEKEAIAQRDLTSLREQLLVQQSGVATQKQLLLGVDDLRGSIEKFGTQVDDFRRDLSERAQSIGIDPKRLTVKFEVAGQEVLIERRNQLDSVIAKLDHGEGLPAKSIVELTAKIAELDKTVAQDKIQRNLIQQLQKRISSNSQETQRLQKEIFTAESETVKKARKTQSRQARSLSETILVMER